MSWDTIRNSFPPFMQVGTLDPTVVATAGNAGFLYVRLSFPASPNPVGLFQKLDNGKTTNWYNVSVPASSIGSIGTIGVPFEVVSPASPAVSFTLTTQRIVFLEGASGPIVLDDPAFVDTTGGFIGKLITFIGTSDANPITIQQSATIDINGNWVGTQGKTLTLIQVTAAPDPVTYEQYGSSL